MRNLKTFSALTTAALSLTLAASAGAAAPTVVKVGPLPGTPAKYNKVFISKYGPSSAKKVLLLIPGTNGGAENFALVGPELAKKVPGLQVWAMDRREQALEDNSMMQKVLANKATPQPGARLLPRLGSQPSSEGEVHSAAGEGLRLHEGLGHEDAA